MKGGWEGRQGSSWSLKRLRIFWSFSSHIVNIFLVFDHLHVKNFKVLVFHREPAPLRRVGVPSLCSTWSTFCWLPCWGCHCLSWLFWPDVGPHLWLFLFFSVYFFKWAFSHHFSLVTSLPSPVSVFPPVLFACSSIYLYLCTYVSMFLSVRGHLLVLFWCLLVANFQNRILKTSYLAVCFISPNMIWTHWFLRTGFLEATYRMLGI